MAQIYATDTHLIAALMTLEGRHVVDTALRGTGYFISHRPDRSVCAMSEDSTFAVFATPSSENTEETRSTATFVHAFIHHYAARRNRKQVRGDFRLRERSVEAYASLLRRLVDAAVSSRGQGLNIVEEPPLRPRVLNGDEVEFENDDGEVQRAVVVSVSGEWPRVRLSEETGLTGIVRKILRVIPIWAK